MATKVKWEREIKIGKGFNVTLQYDFSDLKETRKSLRTLNAKHVLWGWISNKRHMNSGLPLAELAYMQEYGTNNGKGGNIPARPYFRQSLRMRNSIGYPELTSLFTKALLRQNYDSDLTLIGKKNVELFNQSVNKQNMKKLSEITISRKGNSVQWIETGEMLDAFSHKVYDRPQPK